jgi:uncharacterized SAM-binding protein YcdF (DUF218 family)
MKAILKLLVGVFAGPLACATLLCLIAITCRLLGRKRLATGFFVSGAVVAYLGSLNIVGGALLRPLETKFPPYVGRPQDPSSAVTAIVVLGSSYDPHDALPVTAALNREGLARVAEGVRLALLFPSARLVVSGGAPLKGSIPSALGYAKFAREFGISSDRLVVVDTPRDTAQEARAIAALLGPRSFLLVTSASHMPRSVALMKREGLKPLPAPTAHQTSGDRGGWRYTLLPSSSGLAKSELALHEYLGLAAYSLSLD